MQIYFQFAESEVYMEIDMISIGERIKMRRLELHLTQTDIFDQCGITSGALSKIENGKTAPSIIVFHKLSTVLQCDMNWLATGESANVQISTICKKEESLLNSFRKLSEDEQEEFLEFMDIRLRRSGRGKTVLTKSSASMTTEKDDMVG